MPLFSTVVVMLPKPKKGNPTHSEQPVFTAFILAPDEEEANNAALLQVEEKFPGFSIASLQSYMVPPELMEIALEDYDNHPEVQDNFILPPGRTP
jgi:hypothetical protein